MSDLYFPGETEWEAVDPASAGWDANGLEEVMRFAETNRSTGLVMLHNGRILHERYWQLEDIEGSRYERKNHSFKWHVQRR